MTLKKLNRHRYIASGIVGIVITLLLTACNAKDDNVSDNYYTTESVAITNFSLTADIRVMANLDSVFFSIDLEHGVVFNADSLPRGTNVTKLIPKITYPSTVTSAVIEMTGGIHREGTVNYYKNSTDTIDFTGDVTLTLGTNKDAVKKTYRLKVNVHQVDPDTLYWDYMGVSTLPSRLKDPVAQKTVKAGEKVYCLIEESDGTFTMSTTSDLFEGTWDKTELSLGFTPAISSFYAATDGTLYMLGGNNLMTSADGIAWTQASTGWTGIIGSYGDFLLGRKGAEMASFPDGPYDGITLPEGFPTEGFTSPIEFSNRWSQDPTIVLFGGVKADGSLSKGSWAFDGSQWADIADASLPVLEGLSVVDYYTYLNSTSNGHLKEFESYLAFGGRDAEGNVNETVYVTYDHGINWLKAPKFMQLPEEISTGYMVDALTLGTAMESNLSNRWNTRRRLPFEIDGDLIKWNCPYIFLFGGYDANMKLNSALRSGVLQRLTFEPLF